MQGRHPRIHCDTIAGSFERRDQLRLKEINDLSFCQSACFKQDFDLFPRFRLNPNTVVWHTEFHYDASPPALGSE